VSSEHLERDRGDVKAATPNKTFDEGKKGAAEPETTAATKAPPAAAEHLERSTEPSKPGSSHPVMDSSSK
jgi:hypothetical protein